MRQTPRLIFQPDLQQAFLRGIDQIVNAVRPTLGPVVRHVAVNRITAHQAPEILDEGGVIARRIVELPHRTESAGAMLVRQMLWQLQDTVGDGTATAAVIFQRVYANGVRYLSAGGNAMILRRHLEHGATLVLDQLDQQTIPLTGRSMMNRVAEAICYDPELAKSLGEIFDIIGPFGQADIAVGHSRGYETEFVDGAYWNGGVVSERMIRDKLLNSRHLQNVCIFVSDLELDDPHDLIPLLQIAVQENAHGLVIIARKISEPITGLLVTNDRPGRLDIIAMKIPGSGVGDQTENLNDLAVLTGATPLLRATGDTMAQVKAEHLGYARRAWADKKHFGVVGGLGDVHALRQHLDQLQTRYAQSRDLQDRKRLQQRIGTLLGGSASLRVGGVTESEGALRKRRAERTADALRGAIMEGVLPGGGVALLACQPVLRDKLSCSHDPDERAAYRILLDALEAPFKTIASNAGYEPAAALARIDPNGTGCGFDVLTGQPTDMIDAGILDSAAVVKAGVQSAIHTAALALTTDVLVQQKKRPQAIDP